MRASTVALLRAAQGGGYAVGAFNVYNLEGVRAVVVAAEDLRSPAILQIHPAALRHGGAALVALCLTAAQAATVPMAVHLDHAADPDAIRAALDGGVDSIMADGSHLDYAENAAFTAEMAALAHRHRAAVEGELGRLSGTEDSLTVDEYAARLTDPEQAAAFVSATGVDALAVCIGNVHGPYRGEPRLDFDRLVAIGRGVPVPLVLHGVSGLAEPLVRRAVALGCRKLNVNTELRAAYVDALRTRLAAADGSDLLDLMEGAEVAMRAVVAEKLRLCRSIDRAGGL